MNSREDTGIKDCPAAFCATSSITEPSERLRAQPSILHYKTQHCPGIARSFREIKVPVEILGPIPKKEGEVVARRSLIVVSAFPAFNCPGRARTH